MSGACGAVQRPPPSVPGAGTCLREGLVRGRQGGGQVTPGYIGGGGGGCFSSGPCPGPGPWHSQLPTVVTGGHTDTADPVLTTTTTDPVVTTTTTVTSEHHRDRHRLRSNFPKSEQGA